MKQTKMKKILAVILAVVMLTLQSGTVFAAEVTVSGEEAVPKISEEDVKEAEENTAEESAAEESAAEENAEAEQESEIFEPENETVSENVSPNEAYAEDEEAALSAQNEELMGKTAEIFEGIEQYEAGVDYDPDTVYFSADTEEKAEEVAAAYGGTLVSFNYGIGVIRFDEEPGSVSEHVMNTLKENRHIDTLVYPNYFCEIYENSDEKQVYSDICSEVSAAGGINDPAYSEQWFHGAINNEDAWTKSTGKGVTVAVLDTGVDLDHEDLKDNLVGAIDVRAGYTGGNGQDDHNHGSNCAGIVAAVKGNGKGGAGVAPDAKIYSIKCADSNGRLATADIVAGIYAAIDKNVNILSMSFGGHGPVAAYAKEQEAVNKATEAGIVCIAAAGNEATSDKAYPAALNNVMAVAAYNETNGLCSFSNFGKWVDIAAPGNNIYSLTYSGGYGYMSGTSQATPVVSGVAALILSSNPEYLNTKDKATVDKVKKILVSTTDGFSYKNGGHTVKGGVDAAKALDITKPALEMPQKPEISSAVNEANGEVTLTIQTATAGASIYYTLDGSSPTADTGRIKYSSPVVLSRSGKYTVRAVSIKEYTSGQLCSEQSELKVTVNAASAAKSVITSTAEVFNMDTVVNDTADMSGVLTGTEYTFSSSNKKVAVVSSTGIITAVGNGKAEIKAKQKGAKGSVTVKIKVTTPVTKVRVKTSTGLVLDGSEANYAVIIPGGSVKLTPMLTGAKTAIGNVKPSVTGVEWTSSSPDTVSVTPKGVLKCGKNVSAGGTSVITCTAKDGSGLSMSFTVKVVPKAKMLADLRETKIYSDHKKCYKYGSKAYTKVSTKCAVGGSIRISGLRNGVLENFNKVTKVQTTKTTVRYQDNYGRIRSDTMHITQYTIVNMYDEVNTKLPKNSDIFVKSKTKYGTPDEIVFSKPGTYTLKLVTIDGSKKTFKLNVVVK